MDTTTETDPSAPADRTGLRGWVARHRGLTVAGAIAVAALLAVVLWWYQPQALLFDTVVDEAFPTVDADADDAADAPAATDDTDPMDDTDPAATEPMDGDEPIDDADSMDDDAMDDDAATDDEPMDDEAAAPSEPVALSTGSFTSRNRYTVTGEATTYELPDAARVLRLEEFESTNGPDLFVYLTAADGEATDAELDADAVNLGVLTGNIGAQNYDVPADVDLDHYDTVVIWCRRFTTSFGVADLQ